MRDDEEIIILGDEEPVSEPVKSNSEFEEVRSKLAYKPAGRTGYQILNDEVNLSIILIYDRRWAGKIKIGDGNVVVCENPPWHPDDAPKNRAGVAWTSRDTWRLRLWLKRAWALTLDPKSIRRTVGIVAEHNGI